MTLHDVAVDVDGSLAEVRRTLADLGTQLRALRSVGFFGPAHLSEMSQQLEPVTRRALTAPDSAVAGAGIAWESVGPPARSGMLWWRADGGAVTQKIHVDNPASDSYYDFTHSEWYTRAIGTDELVIAGPFIDAWGTDDHTLTPATAVHDDGGVRLGVVAADLDVAVTTERISRVLAAVEGDLILVNDEGHVVVANDPILTPGLRLEPFLSRQRMRVVERAAVPVHGWELLRLDTAT
jgi:hypothetical protein